MGKLQERVGKVQRGLREAAGNTVNFLCHPLSSTTFYGVTRRVENEANKGEKVSVIATISAERGKAVGENYGFANNYFLTIRATTANGEEFGLRRRVYSRLDTSEGITHAEQRVQERVGRRLERVQKAVGKGAPVTLVLTGDIGRGRISQKSDPEQGGKFVPRN